MTGSIAFWQVCMACYYVLVAAIPITVVACLQVLIGAHQLKRVCIAQRFT